MIAVVAGTVFFAGDIIKKTVETLGPELTQAEVTLDKVDLSLTSGEATLTGLVIRNPKGFKTPHTFVLGEVAVKIDTGTITSDTIVINQVIIDSPDVIAEFQKFSFNPLKAMASIQESLETSNFMTIQRNVDSYVKKNIGSGNGQTATADNDKSGDGPKLIIEKFRMNNVKVRAVSQSGLMLDKSIPPFSISLDNIGKKEGGLPPAEIAAILIPAVQKEITDAMTGDLINAAKEMVGKLGDAAKGAMKSVTEGAGSMGKTITEGAGGVGKTVTEGAKGAGDAIKGLFGK
ncbi:MAG: hypothetical protein O3A84_04835 [Proteobacteria bacterium]|nr:hypothetical protein [Pseudomonadota bacterium]